MFYLYGSGLEELSKEIKPITLDDALLDYNKLIEQSCKNINPRSLIGNTAADYFFFKYRLETATKKLENFENFYKQKKYLKTISSKRLYEYGLNNGKNKVVAAYDVFRLYSGSINAFKPIIAKQLYCKYNPTTILDFSSGWGGRCLAAMSMNINYIGYDTNKNLKPAYNKMIRTYPHNSNIKINFVDSSKVDYSKLKYDFVFTSPPYFMKTQPTETYKNMPIYKDRNEFNNLFFFPVVNNTFKYLQKGGHYALNIPIDMYEDIKEILGAANKKIPLSITSRYSGQIPTYKEFIYIWNK